MAGRLVRGDIYICRMGAPDKQRPCVILTRDTAIGHLTSVTVAPISSSMRGVASEVNLGIDDGMKGPCAVNLHNTITVPQNHLIRRVSSLSAEKMEEVCDALHYAMGCG